MTPRWLILADDLTGAADCAIAFARAGLPAAVDWGQGGGAAVRAIDADSRRLDAAAARARHRALLDAHLRPGQALFKKIDSTLRGQPAAELAETLLALRRSGRPAMAVVAPAFPATGRTVQGGRIHLDGAPLESTRLWAREHSYPSGDLPAVLRGEGLRTRLASLADIRGGHLPALLDAGCDALVCDAVQAADLALLAAATQGMAGRLVFVGSAGLAHALAGPSAPPPPHPRVSGGILLAVGSIAEASRQAARALAGDPGLHLEHIDPALLRAGPQAAGWDAQAGRIAATIGTGGDVLAQIANDPQAELSQGAALAARLALLLQPAAAAAGALLATGGETAMALLRTLGVHGIRMIDELAPGVPLGLTQGAVCRPIVTKAGGFGHAGTLLLCLSHLRRLRLTETHP